MALLPARSWIEEPDGRRRPLTSRSVVTWCGAILY
jgi:hypothetical protein